MPSVRILLQKSMGPCARAGLAGLLIAQVSVARADDYRSAVEGAEVVKGKFYPRAGRFQLNVPQVGFIMNQSFVNTLLLSAGAAYHINEWHAVAVEGFWGKSSDREARTCVENFFYDPKRAQSAGAGDSSCDPDNRFDPATPPDAAEEAPTASMRPEDWSGDGSTHRRPDGMMAEKYRVGPYHRKPAYMPIRIVKQMYTASYQFSPVYGKAIWLLSLVGYMDFFGSAGAGVAMSDFYPQKRQVACRKDSANGQLGNGERTLCDASDEGTNLAGAYGKAGRPLPLAQTSPLIHFGLGSRFFLGHALWATEESPAPTAILANVELRNFTIFGSDPNHKRGTMNFFALSGGVGILF